MNDQEKPTFFTIISSNELAEQFRIFLEKRHCEENLLFWIDAQQFRFTHSSVSPDTLTAQAHMIHKKYFETGSQFCLNVDSAHTKNIKSALESGKVTRTMFDDAQHACLLLLSNDSIPKFLKSKDYTQYVVDFLKIFSCDWVYIRYFILISFVLITYLLKYVINLLTIIIHINFRDGNTEAKRKKADRRSFKILLDLKGSLGDEMQKNITEVDLEEEALVEFVAPDIDELCLKLESQLDEEQEWVSQVQSVMSVSINLLQLQAQKNDLQRGEIIYRNITNEEIWGKQIETASLILSSQKYRRTYGLLSLLGRKWLSWNNEIVEQLDKLPDDIPDFSVEFVPDSPVYQTGLMQTYETLRLVIEQFPSEFEYTLEFIVLLTKLTCPKLPGVSFIPLKDEDENDIEIPNFPTLKFFDSFVYKNNVFINRNFQNEPETRPMKLLFPFWELDEFKKANDVYDNWNSSNSAYLLQELLRVDQERQSLASALSKVHSVVQNNLLCSQEFKIFLDSLTDVTDTCVIKQNLPSEEPLSPRKQPRKRARTGMGISRSDSVGLGLRKSKTKLSLKNSGN